MVNYRVEMTRDLTLHIPYSFGVGLINFSLFFQKEKHASRYEVVETSLFNMSIRFFFFVPFYILKNHCEDNGSVQSH